MPRLPKKGMKHPLRRRAGFHAAWLGPVLIALATFVNDHYGRVRIESDNALMLQVLGRQLNVLASQVAYIQGAIGLPEQPSPVAATSPFRLNLGKMKSLTPAERSKVSIMAAPTTLKELREHLMLAE